MGPVDNSEVQKFIKRLIKANRKQMAAQGFKPKKRKKISGVRA